MSKIIFHPSFVRKIANRHFGRGLVVVRPATVEEAMAYYLETTFSAAELAVARHHGITLHEARELIAEAEEALREAELERQAAWEALDGAEAIEDDAPMIWIGDNAYTPTEIPAGECGTVAYRLTKSDGSHYNVVRTRLGSVECDCPDYTYRREGTACMCKHGAALVDAGLIRAPRKPRKKRIDAAKARRMAARSGAN